MLYEITDENFEQEVAQSNLPCVILFTGAWCTLCHEMLPAMEQLSQELDGNVKFCTVDTDAEKRLRIKFAVAALPYIVLVHEHMRTPLFDELVSADRLRGRIQYMLDGGSSPTTRPL